MTDWNFADVLETCAAVRGGSHPALVNGGRRTSWQGFDARAASLATTFLQAGLGHQAKVAQYLYNSNEYLESVFAAFKAGMVPVNTNYRYGDGELAYLWDNADVEAVVFHGAFSERVERLRRRLPGVRLWLHVDDGTGERPSFAEPYESAACLRLEGGRSPVRGPWGTSGDDLYLLYTGGTTGRPKGVMWRQDDLFAILNEGNIVKVDESKGLRGVRELAESFSSSPPVLLPACPLMHGTGSFTAFSCLVLGGTVVTMGGPSFDAAGVLRAVESERVNVLSIVGDAFARPLLGALEVGRYDLSSLVSVISSGAMWSEEAKRGLLSHAPHLALVDVFSSSEALGMGSSISGSGTEARTGRFRRGELATVVDEKGNELPPGSPMPGRLAVSGRIPLGYHKDEELTRRTFPVVGGQRLSVPGDYAMIDPDGSIRLLGRGSVVINTGGEKVFPEEVEEVLKTHPAVADAACVGVPDERMGEAVAAVVEARRGLPVFEEELVAHVRAHLAGYKAPRFVLLVDSIGRSPTGKLDYTGLRQRAAEAAAEVVRGDSPRSAGRSR